MRERETVINIYGEIQLKKDEVEKQKNSPLSYYIYYDIELPLNLELPPGILPPSSIGSVVKPAP